MGIATPVLGERDRGTEFPQQNLLVFGHWLRSAKTTGCLGVASALSAASASARHMAGEVQEFVHRPLIVGVVTVLGGKHPTI